VILANYDPTVAGIIFVLAVAAFAFAAYLWRATAPSVLLGVGLALCAAVWAWQQFEL
jgi:hypothetical protein